MKYSLLALCFTVFFLSSDLAAQADLTDSLAEQMVNRANRLLNPDSLDSALQCGQELLAYSRAKKLPLYESTAWSVFSMVAYYRGETDNAINFQDTALALRRQHLGPDHVQVASALSTIGGMLLDLKGDFEAALQRFEEAQRICDLEPDKCSPNFRAALYNNAGNAEASKGNYEEADRKYRQSYAIRSRYPDDPRYKLAALLNNMGTLKLETGHIEAARDYLLRSEALYLKWNGGEETADLMQVRMNLGIVANADYDDFQAKKYFYDALRLGKLFYADQYLEFGKIHFNLAGVFNEQDSLETAEKHYRTAYEFWEAFFGFHPDQTAALIGLALIAQKRGNAPEALRLYRQAEALEEANFPEKHPRRAYIYHETGRFFSLQGDRPRAREYFLKQLKALGVEELRSGALAAAAPSNLVVTGLTNLGILYFENYRAQGAAGQLDTALQMFALADSMVQQLQELRLSFSEQNQLLRDARMLAEWAMQAEIARYGPKTERIFNRSEQNRALNLYGKFREGVVVRHLGESDSLVSRHRNLQYEIRYYRRIVRELPPGNPGLPAAQLKLSELRQSLRDLQGKLDRFKNYHRSRFDGITASLTEVRQKVLKQGELMIQYFEGDSTLFIFLVGKDRYEMRAIPNNFGLKEKVENMRRGITEYFESASRPESLLVSSLNRYENNARELYNRLIAPLDLKAADSLLIIVPDGVLWSMPFDALLTQAPGMRGDFQSYPYLMKQFRISYAYSASLLREAEQLTSDRKSSRKPLLASAPFDSLYPELQSTRFSVLRESAREVSEARGYLGGDVLTGRQATKEKVLALMKAYRILLFSLHGKAGDEGYIAFFPENGQDHLLRTSEVFDLDLDADLVIFSACETALGPSKPGEGLISLARAFTYAGARGLLTTLWKMNEFSSSGITVNVCRHLRNKVPAHQAIWQAKREWVANGTGETAHPWYWAGIVGMGALGPTSN